MNNSYFEINGRIYITSIPSPNEHVLFRGAPTIPTVRQVQAERNEMSSGGPESVPSPYQEFIERRWDDTPEKRRSARKEYSWGDAPYSFR